MRAFLILALLCSIAHAELILQPAELTPGDQYRLMFVTSERSHAQSSDINFYNDFVQSLANESPLVGELGLEWRAFGSTATVDARDNLLMNPENNDPLFSIYRLDGHVVSPSGNLFGDFLLNVDITELGTKFGQQGVPFASAVFSGTDRDGTVEDGSSLGDTFPQTGNVAIAGNMAFSFASEPAVMRLGFYAVSEPITAVPEPGAMPMLLVGFIVLLSVRRQP